MSLTTIAADQSDLHARRSYWRAVPPTREERRLATTAFDLARRHGLVFPPMVVEVYFATNLLEEASLRGQCDWKSLPVVVWVQSGMTPRQTVQTLIHELTHAHDALHNPRYDELTHEAKERRCHEVSYGILALSGWVALT